MTKRKAKQIALMMVASAVDSLIGTGDWFEGVNEEDKEKIIAEVDDITYVLYKRSEKLKQQNEKKS